MGEKRRLAVDAGLWSVRTNGHEGMVVIESSDFSFDVQMKIAGDFVDYSERLEYAQNICDRLNSTIPESS